MTLALKTCKGHACIYPWQVIHPAGDVNSLAESLDQRFDAFYAAQPKVSFLKCELGYIPESEHPLNPIQFGVESQNQTASKDEP